jgi:hypothetical protein
MQRLAQLPACSFAALAEIERPRVTTQREECHFLLHSDQYSV